MTAVERTAPLRATRALRALPNAVASVGELVILLARVAAAVPRRPLETRAFLREVEKQGLRALGLAALMAGFAGLVLSFQFGEGLERFGARQYIGQLTALALLRETIPVLTAVVLGGRIVAGIAAELGSMAATEQVDAMRALGADPVKKLVVPRVLAASLVLPLLVVLGDVVGVLAGLAVSHLEFRVPVRFYLVAVRDFLLVGDFVSGVVKSAAFGLVLGLIACRAGLAAPASTEGVGRATTGAVVVGSLAVVVLDYVLTRMFFATAVLR